MIAFNLASAIPVYTFSLLLALGVLAGLVWIVWQSPPRQTARRVEAGLLALVGALVGARAVHVAFYWPYFQEHAWESLLFFQGGLSWPGALVGGLLGLCLYTIFSRQSIASLADALLPLLTALTVSAWLGCWLDGCAYGPPASGWWGIASPDEWGIASLRWPLQLAGALLAMIFFWLLESLPWSGLGKSGMRASLGLLGLALLLLGSAMLRADPLPAWRGLPLDAWAAMGFILLALVCLGVVLIRGQSMNRKNR